MATVRPGKELRRPGGGGFRAKPANPFVIPGSPAGGTPPGPNINTPDYQALIQSDPGYLAFEAAKNRNLADAATNRAQVIKALVLQYGGLPAGFSDAYGDLSPADIAAAQGNQFSQEHQLQRAYDQSVLNTKRSMAARGMLESGDLTYGLNQADLHHGQAEYDMGQHFLDALRQAISGYTGAVSGESTHEAQAISDALGRVQNLYPATYGAGSAAPAGAPAPGATPAPAGAALPGAAYHPFHMPMVLRRVRAGGGGFRP